MTKKSVIESGTDEINLTEFTLSLLADRTETGRKTIEVQDVSADGIGRKLIITGSDRYGLPTPFDDYVLLALLSLNGFKNGFENRVFRFTRYEILTLLGWGDSGRSYERLNESLSRWVGISLHYDRAWYDKRSKEYRTVKFHIIEDVSGDSESFKLTWNEVFFRSIDAGHIKTIDLVTFFSLKSAVARKLYRFLNAHLNSPGDTHEFDLATLAYVRIGLTKATDMAQIRRRLKTGIAELVSIGYLVEIPEKEQFTCVRKGTWLIKFRLAQKPQSISEVATMLVEQGVGLVRAVALAEEYPEETIRTQIEVLKWRIRRKIKTHSPGGWLISAITTPYEVPPDFSREKPQVQIKLPLDDNRASARIDSERVRDYLNGITEDERQVLQAEALMKAPEDIRKTYDESDRTMKKFVLSQILNQHVLKTIGNQQCNP